MKLVQGTFSQIEAQTLLTEFTKTKIAFHERKIRTVHDTEEDIKHSERRILQLEQNLRKMLDTIKSKPNSRIDIEAEISIRIAN